VGYLNQKEWDYFTGKQDSKKKTVKTQKSVDLKKELEKEIQTKGKGKGLEALFARLGVYDSTEDPEASDERKEIFDTIQDYLKDILGDIKNVQKIGDVFVLPKIREKDTQIAKALEFNGLQFRIRMVAKYVLSQMKKKLYETCKENRVPMPRSKDESGQEKEMEFEKDDRIRQRGEYEQTGEELKHLDVKKLYDLMGEEMPKFEPTQIVGADQPLPQVKPIERKPSQRREKEAPAPLLQQGTSLPQKPISQSLLDRLKKFGTNLPIAATQLPTTPVQAVQTPITPVQAVQTPITPVQPVSTTVAPVKPISQSILDRLKKFGSTSKTEHFSTFQKWKHLREMAGTSAVFDPKKAKPKAGSGFNWWGAPGNLGGTSIAGEANTAKSDPDGTKGTKSSAKRNSSK
jgi:hypothetical protein